MKIILGLLLVFSAASMAQARLGETPDQVAARFGIGDHFVTIQDGPQAGLKQQNFKKQGFDIEVLFTDVSVGETYRFSSPLPESEIQALLAANSEGHQWKEHNKPGILFWTRDDGATAQLTNLQFEFKSKFLVDKEEAWKTAQLPKPPNVEGF